MSSQKYPFIPKSSLSLTVGDFWAIPISGGYACGIVVDQTPSDYKGYKVSFCGGLLDWSSSMLPTQESIIGSQIIEKGAIHIKTIKVTGKEIIGNIPIKTTDYSPGFFIEYPDNKTAYLYEGLKPIPPATKKEINKYPVLSAFGFAYLEARANYLYGLGED